MGLVKAVAAVDAWTDVGGNTLIEGATTDVSAAYQVTLHITAAPTSSTASTAGLKVIVQVSSNTSGDINWEELTSFYMLVGLTTAKTSILNTCVAGTSAFSASMTAAMSGKGAYLLIDDGASSEIVLEKTTSAGGFTIVDNTTYAHVSTTMLYFRGESISVNIPDTANRVRVLYDNTQDAGAQTYKVRCNLSKITAI